MSVLNPSEYDQAYFDGRGDCHPAGYSMYERWFTSDNDESQGEYNLDMAIRFASVQQLSGKSVLEIGCAKGFFVEDLRSLGIEAHGLDVSNYAIGEASEAVAPYLTVGDARTALAGYSNNQFNVIVSSAFLECISDVNLPDLIDEMNRISQKQIHLIEDSVNSPADYYNVKTIQEWALLGFQRGTILINKKTEVYEVI